LLPIVPDRKARCIVPIEARKSAVRRFFQEGLQNGRTDTLRELLDPHCTYFDGGELRVANRGDFIDYVVEARASYTETSVVIDDLIAEGDKVAARCRYHLTSDGGRSTFAVMGFFQFSEDRIVGIWRSIVAVEDDP
jgi:predicted ester cyclase